MVEAIRRAVIGTDETTDKKNFIWNMIGSGVFAAVSMLLSFFIIRVLGENIGGMFSIAITLSQMFAYIAYFEMRTYQVTDVKRKYSFEEFHGAKAILCIVMMLICVIYMVLKGNSMEKSAIILLMCVYRMIDGYADLYEGTFQQDGRLDLTGKSMFYRTILSAGVMVVSILITHNIVMSIVLAIVAALIGVWIFDIIIIEEFHKVCFDFSKIKEVIMDCFPLFTGAFLWTYILSAGRIAIDTNMASNYQSYYQTLFMPVSVINLFATFILKPSLTTLSEMYDKQAYHDFGREIVKIAGLIAGITVVCMAGAYVVGIPVLSVMVNCDLGSYRGVLVFLMLAGGINSISYFMYYILTIMRKPKSVLFGYLTASILTLAISSQLVRQMGILGAALSFFIIVLYLSTIFLILILINYKKDKRK